MDKEKINELQNALTEAETMLGEMRKYKSDANSLEIETKLKRAIAKLNKKLEDKRAELGEKSAQNSIPVTLLAETASVELNDTTLTNAADSSIILPAVPVDLPSFVDGTNDDVSAVADLTGSFEPTADIQERLFPKPVTVEMPSAVPMDLNLAVTTAALIDVAPYIEQELPKTLETSDIPVELTVEKLAPADISIDELAETLENAVKQKHAAAILE